VILTQLPDLPPRPATARNAAFRRMFYDRWGKENWIVCGRAQRAEYLEYRQTCSIKAVSQGSEHYFVDRRRLTVTDETYLVLNEGRSYGSQLNAPAEAFSFAIFFRPGLQTEVAHAARLNVEQALDADAEHLHAPLEFSENLRRHDKLVSPVLQYIRRHVELGVDDAGWYDEQFHYLLTRMLRREQQLAELPQRIDCVRASKRRELMRRLGWATDFMHSNLHRALTLGDLADAARLSSFHFLRTFRQLHGVTPMEYLRQQRTHRALALLESTNVPVSEVAQLVGLSRLTLWRTVSKAAGRNPKTLRAASRALTAKANENGAAEDCAVEEESA
jgi:AraC family transcriptional regulator